MASSTENTSDAAAISIPALVSPPAINVTKLSKDNYHVWKAQLIPFFRGQGIFGYLDGTIPIPSKEISAAATSSVISNPLYEHWQRQDAVIVAILFSTISENVLIQVVSYTTSAAIWCALAKSFSSQSRARVIQLRTELVNTRKGSQSAHDFFMQIKRMTDELAVAGHALHCDEIISYLLSGLGHDYDSLVTAITARTDPVTLEEVYALLLTTEARLQHNNGPPIQPAVHVATRQQHFSSYRGRNMYRGRGRNFRDTYFRDASSSNNSNGRNNFHRDAMICQVCDKPGTNSPPSLPNMDAALPVYSSNPEPSPPLPDDTAPSSSPRPLPQTTDITPPPSNNHPMLELFLSSGTACLSIYSLVAGIFGVNILYTWNDNHGYLFKWVVIVTGAFCAFLFLVLMAYARYKGLVGS
uniref:Magnesium transporter n=1 Tax=Populus alba TaxID=43335 RepID=A0A4U5Q588_POPAL|nr:magnesium transporter [Populus alba]